jgi:putative phosphoesterase
VSGAEPVANVGVISDTHGGISPAALAALAGVDAIVHAGDVGEGGILELLREIAPVTVVRGNDDHGTFGHGLPEVANVRLGGMRFLIAHKLEDLDGPTAPAAAGARIVVSGHTHVPKIEERGGILFVNPGSAFLPRGGNDATVAIVSIGADGSASARLVPLG